MFDVGFSEVLVCLVVALIVLGPERLPGVARSMGRWAGQAKSYMRNLSAELERETQVNELKRQLEEAKKVLHEHADVIEGTAQKIETQVSGEISAVRNTTEPPKS